MTHKAQGPLQPWAQLSQVLGKPDPALLLLTTAPIACAIPPRAGILWESHTCTPWLSKIHTSPSKTTNKADQGLFQTVEETDLACSVPVPPRLLGQLEQPQETQASQTSVLGSAGVHITHSLR